MLRKFIMLCAAVALAGTLAFAQTTTGTAPTPPDPATMAALQVNQLASQLDLTSAQKASAITIYTNAITAGRTIQTSLRTDQQALAAAVKTNAVGTIETTSTVIGTLEGQLTSSNAKAEAAFYALLTADQKKLYDAMPHGGPGGRGGRGGPGGGMMGGGMMGGGMMGNGMRGRPPQ